MTPYHALWQGDVYIALSQSSLALFIMLFSMEGDGRGEGAACGFI